jgi:hypothetical protein
VLVAVPSDVRFGVYSVEKVLSEKQTRMRVAWFSFLRTTNRFHASLIREISPGQSMLDWEPTFSTG